MIGTVLIGSNPIKTSIHIKITVKILILIYKILFT